MKSLLIVVMLLVHSNLNSIAVTRDKDAPERILDLINQLRWRNGLPKLKYATHRQAEVDAWAKRLEKKFAHASNGFAVENIAVNFTSYEDLFYQWRNSPGHRRNMLSRKIKYCAIGLHTGQYKSIDEAFFWSVPGI